MGGVRAGRACRGYRDHNRHNMIQYELEYKWLENLQKKYEVFDGSPPVDCVSI